ncbi:transposase domain-containing protein [Azospira oryzae]|uniref:transposase domain-containing protein n=1 Tax=Azospira oryzae TaxID=146939 RepID=UPI00196607F9
MLRAKANGITPFKYLRYMIETLPTLKRVAKMHQLLPWNDVSHVEAAERAAA